MKKPFIAFSIISFLCTTSVSYTMKESKREKRMAMIFKDAKKRNKRKKMLQKNARIQKNREWAIKHWNPPVEDPTSVLGFSVTLKLPQQKKRSNLKLKSTPSTNGSFEIYEDGSPDKLFDYEKAHIHQQLITLEVYPLS